jgi:hypothetical protein
VAPFNKFLACCEGPRLYHSFPTFKGFDIWIK